MSDLVQTLYDKGVRFCLDVGTVGGSAEAWMSPAAVWAYLENPGLYRARVAGFDTVELYREWMDTEGTVQCTHSGCRAFVSGHTQLEPGQFLDALADPRCPKHGGTVLCQNPYCSKHRKPRTLRRDASSTKDEDL